MIQRQESTIYEEDMPVVMRRRGVTMRVRIVSVDSPTNSAPASPWTVSFAAPCFRDTCTFALFMKAFSGALKSAYVSAIKAT